MYPFYYEPTEVLRVRLLSSIIVFLSILLILFVFSSIVAILLRKFVKSLAKGKHLINFLSSLTAVILLSLGYILYPFSSVSFFLILSFVVLLIFTLIVGKNKIILLAVVTLIFLGFFYPKQSKTNETCSCVGSEISITRREEIWKYCLGIPHSCIEEPSLVVALAGSEQYYGKNIKVRGRLDLSGKVSFIFLENGDRLAVCCEINPDFDREWVEITGLLEPPKEVKPGAPSLVQYTEEMLHLKQIEKIQFPEVDLTDEEKAIIERIKRSTPLGCDPRLIPRKVEVHFKDDDPYFSEKEAKKIVEAFASSVSVTESTSFEQEVFYFDLKEELPLSKNEPIFPILEAKFKNIPKVKSFELVASEEKVENDKLIIIFTEQITPTEAEDIIRQVYPSAVVLIDNKTPHHKNNPIYFRLEVAEGKERDLVAFLRDNPKVKTVQRMFTGCIVP